MKTDRRSPQARIKQLSERLREKPKDPKLLSLRAYYYVEIGAYHQALKDLNRALHLRPKDTFSLELRGDCYARMRHYVEAFGDYDRAIRLGSNKSKLIRKRLAAARNLPSAPNRSFDTFEGSQRKKLCSICRGEGKVPCNLCKGEGKVWSYSEVHDRIAGQRHRADCQ